MRDGGTLPLDPPLYFIVSVFRVSGLAWFKNILIHFLIYFFRLMVTRKAVKLILVVVKMVRKQNFQNTFIYN